MRSARELQLSARRFQEADEALRKAAPGQLDAAARAYLDAREDHQANIDRARGDLPHRASGCRHSW
jgi:hypothetical protein